MCCTCIRKRLEKADAKWTAKATARTTLVPASPTTSNHVVPGMLHPSSRRRQLQELNIMTSTPVTTSTTAAKNKPPSRLLSFFKTAKTTATTTNGNSNRGTLPTTKDSSPPTTRIKPSSWPGMIRGSWLASKTAKMTTATTGMRTSTTAVTLAVGGINDSGSDDDDDGGGVDIEITVISPRSSPSAARERFDRFFRTGDENILKEVSENNRSPTPSFNIDHRHVNTNRRGRGRGRRHSVEEIPTGTPEPEPPRQMSRYLNPRRRVRFAEELEETFWISPNRSPESSSSSVTAPLPSPSKVELRPAASVVGILQSSSPADTIGNMLRHADFLTSERTEDARGYKGRILNQLSSLSKQMKKLQKQAIREEQEQEAAAAMEEDETSFEELDYRDDEDENGGRRAGAASGV